MGNEDEQTETMHNSIYGGGNHVIAEALANSIITHTFSIFCTHLTFHFKKSNDSENYHERLEIAKISAILRKQ